MFFKRRLKELLEASLVVASIKGILKYKHIN